MQHGSQQPDRTQLIFEAYASGLTYHQIGKKFSISRQRVHQLIRPPSEVASLVIKRAKNCCENCGIPQRHGHIHHTVKDGDFNEPKLLRYLCPSCHRHCHKTKAAIETHKHIFVGRTKMVSVKATKQEHSAWRRAAHSAGKRLSVFIREALNAISRPAS